MLGKSVIPPLLFVFSISLLELTFFFSEAALYSIAVGSLLIIAAVYYLIPSHLEKRRANFIIFPLLVYLAFFLYILIQSNRIIIQLLILGCSLVIYFYFKAIFNFFFRQGKYKAFSLENISSYGGFVAFFLFAASFFAYQSALNLPLWAMMMALLAYVYFLIYDIFWLNKIGMDRGLIFILAAIIMMIELAWAISYLPLSYNIAGMCLVIFYYMGIGILKHYLAGNLEASIIKLYVGVGGASLILILLTARWF